MMDFTLEQAQAIHTHDHNLIVVAGAGSGKTRVLVERYLALLDANSDWPLSSLVAITFTRKAAQEMRDRVRQELERRLNTRDQYPDSTRWASLLSQIDSARVDTIHSLCTALLRANAASIGVDPDFTVLDETESQILLEDTVNSVLAGLVMEQADELRLLAEYGPDAVRRTLADAALLSQKLPVTDQDWMVRWGAQWQEMLEQEAQRFLMMDAVSMLRQWDAIPHDDKIGQQCEITLDGLVRLETASDAGDLLDALGILGSINRRGGSAKNWGDQENFDAAKALLRVLKDEADKILKNVGRFPGEADQQAAELLPLWLRLIGRVQAAFRKAKARNSVLDFDDLERLTCDMLQNDPEVRARYRQVEFRHLLVDEFQDTNARQWQIVKALAPLDNAGSMFVVGDQKQSIYAFRGADVSVFGAVRAEIIDADGRDIQMARSFRTHAPLVNAFNAIFERLLVRQEASPVADYQVMFETPMSAHRADPPDSRTFVEVMVIPQYEVDESGQPLHMDGDKPVRLNSEERRHWEAHEIARRIQQMVDEGWLVHDPAAGGNDTRPAAYGDFAILFQALTQVQIYEGAFAQRAIPYLTVAGRGYFDRQEVWDLLNLLRAVYQPYDDLALASVLRSPMFGLSDDALFALRVRTEFSESTGNEQVMPLWNALADPGELFPAEEVPTLHFAHQCLDDLRQVAGRITILELLTQALEETSYLAILSALPDGARMRENVRKLLRIAQERGRTTLVSFEAYLRDLTAREVREGDAAVASEDSVTLMTVHASKGLEFPVVILADTSWTRQARSDSLLAWDERLGWACKVPDPDEGKTQKPAGYAFLKLLEDQREEAERLRHLYVAATRARDYLLISGQADADREGEWRSKGWLGRLLEVLDLNPAMAADIDEVIQYDWGELRLYVPGSIPVVEGRERLPIRRKTEIHMLESETFIPAMVEPLDPQDLRQVRHLPATQIAHLGGIETALSPQERRRYVDLFRRQTLHGAPDYVHEFRTDSQLPSRRLVGEIVHEALHHQQLPSLLAEHNLLEILKHYGWRKGIIEPDMNTWAATEAFRHLQEFESGAVPEWIVNAEQIYRELPFVLEHESYVIHGIIDILLRQRDGRWVLIDYKTGSVPSNPQALRSHARQFHLQVGIYALAVATQLDGIIPEVVIHFIQKADTPVIVTEAEWRHAVGSQLDRRIYEVLEERANA